jgi:hypothetical protein
MTDFFFFWRKRMDILIPKNKSDNFSVSVQQNFPEKYLFCHLKSAFGYKEVTVQYVTNFDMTILLQ